MSIRRVYVCDRCGAEAPALDQGIINHNAPRGWSKVTSFPSFGVRRTLPRAGVYHLCNGCSILHLEWLKPMGFPGYRFKYQNI